MKIMMAITELTPAGAERIVLELVRRLIPAGNEVCVVSLMPYPRAGYTAIAEALQECGAQLRFLSCGKNPVRLVWGLRKVIRDFQPDLIHAHLIHPSLLIRFACLFNRIPVINTVHIAERRKGKGLFFLLDRLTVFRCDLYTAVSQAAAEFQERKCGFPEGLIRVIPNGSDKVIPLPPEKIRDLKKEWGLDDCTEIAGAAGRLDFQKGYDLFLEAVPEIAKRLPPGKKAGFLFIGEGASGTRLRKKAEEWNGKYKNIHIVFPGYRKDAASCLAMLDLFLMPSRYEGYGLALAEAFSLGLPALSSEADSLPEICRNFPGHYQFCSFQDPKDTAEKFLTALSLKKFEGRTIFSCNQMADAYGKEYCLCIKKRLRS